MDKTMTMAVPANRNAKDGLTSLLNCPTCRVGMRLTCRCPEARGVLISYECPSCHETETVMVLHTTASPE
jgi:predicted RNA-binding Zn-ribbon protein involved in translation (DUF1610 family)